MNHEILITSVSFDGDRYRTAAELVEAIQEHLESNDMSHIYSPIIQCDIPMSTNPYDQTCIAFLRLQNTRHDRDFLERLNARILFHNQRVTLRLSREPPKPTPEFYLRHEVVWVRINAQEGAEQANNENPIPPITFSDDEDKTTTPKITAKMTAMPIQDPDESWIVNGPPVDTTFFNWELVTTTAREQIVVQVHQICKLNDQVSAYEIEVNQLQTKITGLSLQNQELTAQLADRDQTLNTIRQTINKISIKRFKT